MIPASDSRFKVLAGDFFGAFSDSAILLTLVLLLSQVQGFSLPFLLASAGITFLMAGAFFKVPISVQPLKSIAIASAALGASALEIRTATLLLGAFFTGLYFLKIRSLPLPEAVIRAVQSGLGVLLLTQAAASLPGTPDAFASLLIAASILVLHYRFKLSTLGFFALSLFLGSLFFSKGADPGGVSLIPTQSGDAFRIPLVLSLLLPQIALTSANSISGAFLALSHHFPQSCKKVSIPRLMASVGFGNLMAGAFSGLPFCHGAGGITAHAKGGATTARMNAIMGCVLIFTALGFSHLKSEIRIHPFLLSPILACIGVFHLELGRPLWGASRGRILFAVASLITLFTSNLLYCLIGAFFVHSLQSFSKKRVSHG